ncbi:MAG: Mut7-C RNAse domain-containing protein [Candidatus Binataceae bacterium]
MRRWAFSRCALCNEPVTMVPRETLWRRIPPFVYASHDNFAVCARCGRVYWGATHPERVLRELDAIGL